MKRREFLKHSSYSAAALGLAPLLRLGPPEASSGGRRLVLVQLTGGCDALSMVVPRKNEQLQKLRPTLSLPDSRLVHLSESFGLHPNLAPLHRYFKNGRMSVINNVGYLPPNRSHFRSLDIWHSAVTNKEETKRGWIGQALAEKLKKDKTKKLGLFHVGSGPQPLCFGGSPAPITTLRDLKDLTLRGDRDTIQALAKSSKKEDSDLDFLRKSTESALDSAKKIAKGAKPSRGTFSKDSFGKQMSLVSSLARSFRGDQVFFTTINGFDTHAVQQESLPALLASLGRGVDALLKDLDDSRWGETTILVYSEFGRRVKENASRGTDHGAAGSVLVLGKRVKSGIHGGPSDLANLMDGDLSPRVDFRTVYADVLSGVLGLNWSGLKPSFGAKPELIRRR